jgi:glycerol-3-phosphate dehydrogenase (NAD(P)+)
MTRGLEEMRRIGVALGGQSETFMGLSGMGDLIVTCSSNHSRNRRVGLALAEGKQLNDILDEMQMVAEGVRSVISAKALCEKLQLEDPIISAIYDVLYNNVKARDALKTLMTREVKPERWD